MHTMLVIHNGLQLTMLCHIVPPTSSASEATKTIAPLSSSSSIMQHPKTCCRPEVGRCLDLSLCDYFLFSVVEEPLWGQRFESAEAIKSVNSIFLSSEHS
jgi:hypothetical protein